MMCSMAGEASNAAITLDSRIISGLVPTTVVTFNFMLLLYIYFSQIYADVSRRFYFSQMIAD
jgi:uncharacterized membrane-anchored protein